LFFSLVGGVKTAVLVNNLKMFLSTERASLGDRERGDGRGEYASSRLALPLRASV